MKQVLIPIITVCFLSLLFWCENKETLNEQIEKTTIIQYCESNGWYIGWTDDMVCYFANSSCNAVEFYEWKCLPVLEQQIEYDENLAEQYCTQQDWVVNTIDVWWNDEKICIFPNQSVCSLIELFNWDCDI